MPYYIILCYVIFRIGSKGEHSNEVHYSHIGGCVYGYISIPTPIYQFLPLLSAIFYTLHCVLKYSGLTSLDSPKLNYFEFCNFKMEVWVKVHLRIVECNHSARIFT